MKRSRLVLLGLGLLVVVLGGGYAGGRLLGSDEPGPAAGPRGRTVGSGFAEELAKARGRTGEIAWTPPERLDGGVTISGTVIDTRLGTPVGGVEVVFLGEAGEESTTAGADGKYHIDLPIGTYRAFVRDETVLSVGRMDHVRLPGMPSADTVGVPDETLMPVVIARADADGVDLSVMRGGAIHGRVVDRGGKPIANVMLRARGTGFRPALGTDLAETGSDGTFELKLPAGEYDLEASHARYAGVANGGHIMLEPGDIQTANVTLTAGCVIAGRVVRPGGQLAGDGAIERQWGTTDLEFAPSGRIAADGTFRWVTTEELAITLRAWPWKSPPSLGKQFACKDGARFENVVFELPDRGPDIEGVLVDHAGAPVAMAFIDLAPLDPGGIGQQERTDASGRWAVYQMPQGHYRVTAFAPGRGVVSSTVTSPQTAIRLQLGGTGRIEGTTTLANGSFELMLGACFDDEAPVPLSQDRRLVTVTNGRFAVDEVPACNLQFVAIWRGKPVPSRVTVPAGGTAQVELLLGPPRAKTVHGVVTDAAGRPVEGANVTASFDDQPVTATTDGAGRFSLRTFAGASVFVFSKEAGIGTGEVGSASADNEQIDIRLSREELEGHGGPTHEDPMPYPDDPSGVVNEGPSGTGPE